MPLAASLDQIGPFAQTVKENAQLLNVVSGHDVKDATSTINEIADFTSKIGQDIKGMKIALPKEYMGEGIDPQVKETILKVAKHLESLGRLSRKSACHILSMGLLFTTLSHHQRHLLTLQRFDGIRYGFRAEDATNLDEIYVKPVAKVLVEEVKRRIMLGTFSLSSGYYDAYFKKAGQVWTLIIQDFEKVFVWTMI